MPRKAIRFGVIGLNFGQQIVRTLANIEEAQLVAIAHRHDDHLPGGLEDYAAKYEAAAYRDGSEMLEKEKLDAVCICTLPKGREDLLTRAVEKKIALFVEKPWAANLEQARSLMNICRDAVAPVMTAFSFRYHPAIVRLRELIAGELGAVLSINAEYLFDWRPGNNLWDPAGGNGFFNENSCHLFDGIMSLAGDPVTVSAEAINPFTMPGEHAAAVTMRLQHGAIAAITIGGIGASGFHETPRIDLVTTNGQARLRGRNHVWETVEWTLRGQQETRTLTLSPEALGNTRYTDALRHFVHCIREGKAPVTGPLEGLKSVAVAMAVVESSRSGKKVDVRY